MKYKIGIFGSAEGELEKIIPKARELGKILAKRNVIIITEACAGLPYKAALSAYQSDAEIPQRNINSKLRCRNNHLRMVGDTE